MLIMVICEEALEEFRQLQQVALTPDQISYMSLLNACSCPVALEPGREVHAHVIDTTLQSDLRVEVPLVNMYAESGSVRDARLVFDEMGKQSLSHGMQ